MALRAKLLCNSSLCNIYTSMHRTLKAKNALVGLQPIKRGATHRPPLVYSEIIDRESARAIILQLSEQSRENFAAELHEVQLESLQTKKSMTI